MPKQFPQIINTKCFTAKYFTNFWHTMVYNVIMYISAPLNTLQESENTKVIFKYFVNYICRN